MGSLPWIPLLCVWTLPVGLVTLTCIAQLKHLHLSWGMLSSLGQRSNRGSEGFHTQRHTALERHRTRLNREPTLVCGTLPALLLFPAAFVSEPWIPSPAMSLGLGGFLPARQSVHLGTLGWGGLGTSRRRADSHEWRQGFQGHVLAPEATALSLAPLSSALPLELPVGIDTDTEKLVL